jgi:feruloyl esterase
MRRLFLAIAGVALAAPPAAAQPAPSPPAAAGVACAALARADFARLSDAPTQISSATEVAATATLPAYCRVEGYVAPSVGFEVRLPRDWNGKYLQQGCGGMCGWINMGACEDALARGYAVANTDMGHKAPPNSVLWAKGNRQAQIDFGFRATHVLAVAAKAIVAAHYGRPHRYAYFRGCSTGGRQGMLAAQRFPHDFDGIIAGAPVVNELGDGVLHLLWSGRASLGPDGRPALTPEKVALVHRAVMAACDHLDGAKDGVLMDPESCPWRAETLACRAGPAADCLTSAELAAVARIRDGAKDSRGRALFPGGMPLGSEHQWVPAFVGRDGQPGFVLQPGGMIPDFLRYLAFHDPAPDYDPMAFDWDRDSPRLALMETLYNAQNPDLSAFAARGGKLIAYHGWDDLEVPARLSVAYWQALEPAMGGRDATRRFARLFLMPGVAHCRRGPGADAVDWLSALEAWVERGEAPDRLIAHHLVTEQSYLGLPPLRYPLPREAWDWARPLSPWPDVPRFVGGDWRDPAAWRTGAPLRRQ